MEFEGHSLHSFSRTLAPQQLTCDACLGEDRKWLVKEAVRASPISLSRCPRTAIHPLAASLLQSGQRAVADDR